VFLQISSESSIGGLIVVVVVVTPLPGRLVVGFFVVVVLAPEFSFTPYKAYNIGDLKKNIRH